MKRMWVWAAVAGALAAQPVSSYKYSDKGGEKTVEITNVSYQLAGKDLVLRTTVVSKENLGDIGVQATTTVEAWKLGADMKTRPVYTVKATGTGSRILDHDVFEISRGTEEVDWWSLYSAASGAHLLDTYTPLVAVNINRESLTKRYVGLELPEDDKLKDPHHAGIVNYASTEKLIRRAVISCDDPKLAAQLRSLADEEHTVTATASAIKIVFSEAYPRPYVAQTVTIPIVRDDLDLARAQAPPKCKVTP